MICFTKQNKKGRKVCGTWRVPAARDSQIGQLMYYLMAVQLRRLQLHLRTPRTPRTPRTEEAVSPLLGLYMEDNGGIYSDINVLGFHITKGNTVYVCILN